ncbi:hypothetical protein GYMLUDRAFT_943811 [Collybiopsis luxurians FD-317 M1]|uniref:Uncharacterized protein n=1 Tax=Collybiopsis luxurians FD-317 M1 TaxID=944289 RepID=A0A0D0BU16_9AGAR|nr:hypothetical protein GYMLUDRAFT_943811 [Collybiopsis luxurians FD-317 M1]
MSREDSQISKAIEEPLRKVYTALSLRPYVSPQPSTTCWFLPLTYIDVGVSPYRPRGTLDEGVGTKDPEKTRRVAALTFLTARAERGTRVRAEIVGWCTNYGTVVRSGSGSGGRRALVITVIVNDSVFSGSSVSSFMSSSSSPSPSS